MLHSVKVMHIVVLSSTSSEGHCKEIPTNLLVYLSWEWRASTREISVKPQY